MTEAAVTESALLSLLARARATLGTAPTGPAGPVARGAGAPPAPASFVQEQLWFVHHLAPTVPMHNITFAFDIDGPVDVDALGRAWAALPHRHPVLRTRLRLTPDGLVQDQAAAVAPLAVGSVTGDQAEEQVRRLAATRFDLGRGPLLRARLLRVGPHQHTLACVAHHAVVDGWSVGILLDDLAAAYAEASAAYADASAAHADASAATRPAGLQFADVAAWQREWVAGERLEQLSRQWRERLAGAVPTAVPADHPRPQVQTFAAGIQRFRVPPNVAQRLAGLTSAERVSSFMALLAAFAALLAAESGSRDITIGTPVAGRGRPELERVVGPVSDTLPLRFPVRQDASYRSLLRTVADAVFDLAGLQDMPFSQLVKVLDGPRDISRNPAFQTLFNIGNLPQGADGVELAGGARLRPRPVPNGTVRLDLELTMEPGRDALAGRLEYNSALYTGATAQRLTQRYLALLDRLTRDPAAPLAPVLEG